MIQALNTSKFLGKNCPVCSLRRVYQLAARCALNCWEMWETNQNWGLVHKFEPCANLNKYILIYFQTRWVTATCVCIGLTLLRRDRVVATRPRRSNPCWVQSSGNRPKRAQNMKILIYTFWPKNVYYCDWVADLYCCDAQNIPVKWRRRAEPIISNSPQHRSAAARAAFLE